ncbi:hypothetical protein KILIM_017_00370 [Kineosphaera limosa NBRC 100340]|uniref:EamA domain-containing protein n=2 Tax=Kineosphaera TaxID=211469 RepID=K6WSW6_9MICO|nr:hypothetical protein KILIM_017_00370 [Kineosphaera limosa NBRC 100340]
MSVRVSVPRVGRRLASSPGMPRRAHPFAGPAAGATLRGLAWALLSCIAFGLSGTLAKGLMATGWSPLTTVSVRVGGAALLMGLPALWFMRHRLGVLRRHAGLIVGYGVIAVASTQLCYFLAVQTLPVAVALLIEYLAPIIIVGWLWARHGQRPGPLTVLGAVLAMTGLALVLGITGAVPVDLVGIGWALGAAVSLAGYFLLAAKPAPDLPPLVLVGVGMGVGTLTLLTIAALRVLPWQWSSAPVPMGPWVVSPLVPLTLLVLVTAVVAYTAGLFAARSLGSRVASFVSLVEVLAAVLFAWLFLAEVPGATQALGGVAILLGAIAVKVAETRSA